MQFLITIFLKTGFRSSSAFQPERIIVNTTALR